MLKVIKGFNPLTRIRSSLTLAELPHIDFPDVNEFQSPHEDSFFSDPLLGHTHLYDAIRFQSPHEDSFFSDESGRRERDFSDSFQSPHEDSFFSDDKRHSRGPERFRIVSIPSRGFVLL